MGGNRISMEGKTMDKDTRYRLALINMAQGAQRQADSIRAWAYSVPTGVAAGNEEQAQAYERVAVLLTDEADALRKAGPD